MKRTLIPLIILSLIIIAGGCSSADSNSEKQNTAGETNNTAVVEQTNAEEANVEETNTIAMWMEDIPEEVPEFTYGDVIQGEKGMGSWIVDFENVPADALEKYNQDLKNAGWSASYIAMTHTITGNSDSGKYSIIVNMDPDGKVAQIIVSEK